MNVEILRPFPGPGGRTFETGEVVDASNWLHTQKLITQGMIRKAKKPVADADTRGVARSESQQGLTSAGKKKKLVGR